MTSFSRGRVAGTVFLTGILAAAPAHAWLATGHAKIAEQAVRVLPDSVPLFFRAGFAEVGRSAMDPDFYRLRDLPQLRNGESPEHYLDSELLEGAKWPESRYGFIGLLSGLDKDAFAVGMLPYSLVEGVQRLAASFAQVRLDPSDEWAQARALHHGGIMAHYAADLCQPLHTTIHYNGRAKADGSSPRSGIHLEIDGLTRPVFAEESLAPGHIRAAKNLLEAIEREFDASHALVDRVYELDGQLDPDRISGEALQFGRERITASIRFTAALFLTAWELSGEISLPEWYRSIQPAPSPEAPPPSR
ncbi:MAG: hypothetical protein ACE5GX_05505 [Thermoanaerobaculia bacterium]